MSFEARGRLPGTFETLRFPILAAVIVAVGIAALAALAALPDGEPPRDLALGSPAPSAVATPSASLSPDALASPTARALPFPWVALEPGRHGLPFFASGGPWAAEAWIRLTVPDGWAANANGMMLERYPLGGPTLSLSVHAVRRVATDLCDPAAPFVEVGPGVQDLMAALSSMRGVSRTGPTDVTVGGHPATRIALTVSADCPGPERRWVWEDVEPRRLGIDREGGSVSVIGVDLGGARVVIAVHGRGASSLDVAEMRRIVDSIEFDEPSREVRTSGALTPP